MTAQAHDKELLLLLNEFDKLYMDILSLKVNHPPRWQMHFRILNSQKQICFDKICNAVKTLSPEIHEDLQKSFYDKYSIVLA